MKAFAVGAVVISMGIAALTTLLVVMAPLGKLQTNRGRAPAQESMNFPAILAMGFLGVVVLGSCSHGIGEGLLEHLSRRKNG